MVKYLDKACLTQDIVGLNIPNGIPLVYELDAELQAHQTLLPGRRRSRRQGRRSGRIARQGLIFQAARSIDGLAKEPKRRDMLQGVY